MVDVVVGGVEGHRRVDRDALGTVLLRLAHPLRLDEGEDLGVGRHLDAVDRTGLAGGVAAVRRRRLDLLDAGVGTDVGVDTDAGRQVADGRVRGSSCSSERDQSARCQQHAGDDDDGANDVAHLDVPFWE